MLTNIAVVSILVLAPAHAHALANEKIHTLNELDVIDDTLPGRLVKDKNPIPEASFHEEDPIDPDGVDQEGRAYLVKNRKPVTRKVKASGKHAYHCTDNESDNSQCESNFSLVAWKMAGRDGDITGTMQEDFVSGEQIKVEVDCLVTHNGDAVVGGLVTKANRAGMENLVDTRTFVLLKGGAGDSDQISALIPGDCNNYDFESAQDVEFLDRLESSSVSVCNRRDGEDTWQDCLTAAKATTA